MLVQILSNTPIWVFALFFVLLVFGLMQTRARTVPKILTLLLLSGMIALSLLGIASSFGLRLVPVASYGVAVSIAALVWYALFRDKGVEYDATTAKFFVPGSWVPLGVITAIFVATYAYGVMHALNVDVISAPLFIVFLSAVYGLLSGYFTARGFNLIKTAKMVWQ